MMNITEAIASLSPLLALLFTLGAIGWWRLIARDSIFERQRDWFWRKFPYEGFVVPQQDQRPKRGKHVWSGGAWYCQKGTKLGELVHCPWCLSWWVGVLQFGAYMLWPHVVLALALAHTVRIGAALIDNKL